jgi:fatty-acyl-CoA synthase
MAAVTLRGERLDGAAFAAELGALLPAYAVPVFLRLRDRHDTTPTFKFRKVDLKREGFDPAQVSDAVYVLRDRRRGYEPMTADTYAAIEAGRLRL